MRSHAYYHNIVISDRAGKTLQTPGTHLTSTVMPLLERFGFPRSLTGQSVLDIGCNAGFYAASSWLRGHRFPGYVLFMAPRPSALGAGRKR